MFSTCLFVFFLAQTSPSAPVTLSRVFKAGDSSNYSVKARLFSEQRGGQLETWIPDEVNLEYKFTTLIKRIKADGIAELIYDRPTITTVSGEDFNSGPKTLVDKIGQRELLTLSPLNQILDSKSVDVKAIHGSTGLGRALGIRGAYQGAIFKFLNDLHRLAVLVGSLDSSLDFNPKFSLDPVKIGDTWKQTVGYQPQALKNSKGKQAVQRLDITYEYRGLAHEGKRTYQQVSARIRFDNDIATFVNQAYQSTSAETGLQKLPLRLSVDIDFRLDPQTFQTLKAVAKSEGGFSVYATDAPERPIVEERFKGSNTMVLLPKVSKGR